MERGVLWPKKGSLGCPSTNGTKTKAGSPACFAWFPPCACARARARGAETAKKLFWRQNRKFPVVFDQTELRGIPGGVAGRPNAQIRTTIDPEVAEL